MGTGALVALTVYGAFVSTVALGLRWAGRRVGSRIRTAAKERAHAYRMSAEYQEYLELHRERERHTGYNSAGQKVLDDMSDDLRTAEDAADAQQERVRGAGEARGDLLGAFAALQETAARVRVDQPGGIQRAVSAVVERFAGQRHSRSAEESRAVATAAPREAGARARVDQPGGVRRAVTAVVDRFTGQRGNSVAEDTRPTEDTQSAGPRRPSPGPPQDTGPLRPRGASTISGGGS